MVKPENEINVTQSGCNIEWLHELGNNTKLVKARFGVVVHRTLIEDFDLENSNI